MLHFSTPWLNAAGSLGFAPDAHSPISLAEFGAFVTNPISLRPRRASDGPRLVEHPGGVLLHTGLPNPGLANSIRRYAAKWGRAELPIIPHLMVDQPGEGRRAVLRLEELENIKAIELGLDGRVDPVLAVDLARAALGELPLLVRVPLERGLELASRLFEAGAAAISLGPPSGALLAGDGGLDHGRVYGPGVYPQAMAVVAGLAALEIPVIGAGGVGSRAQGEAMLKAGALAVQFDVSLWKAAITAH